MSFAAFLQVFGLLSALGALWWRVENRVSQGSVDAMKRANEAMEKIALVHAQMIMKDEMAQRELHAFRLEVVEKYAKTSMLSEIETNILSEFREFRKDFHDAMLKLAASNASSAQPRTRSKS